MQKSKEEGGEGMSEEKRKAGDAAGSQSIIHHRASFIMGLPKGVLAIGTASLFSDLSHEMATAVLPLFLAAQVGASAAALGIIEGVADGLASYCKLWGGWWTDRSGRRKPIAVAGYLATALATASLGLARHWVMALISRSIAWAARGMRSPARSALLSDIVTRESYGRAYGFERAMDSFGAVLAPLAVLYLIGVGLSYRSILTVTLLPGVAAALAILFFVKEFPRPPKPERRLWGDVKTLPRPFLYFMLIAGVFGLGQFAPTLLVLRATEILRGSSGGPLAAAREAIALYVLFNALQTISSYTSGMLSRRLGSIPSLALGYGLFAITALGFAVLGTPAALIALFSLAGVAVGIIEAMEPTVAAELLPADRRGTGFGALGAANGVGDLLSSALVGILWSRIGPLAGFGAAGLFNVASLGVLLSAWPALRKGYQAH